MIKLCNLCGEDMRPPLIVDVEEEFRGNYGLHDAVVTGGYESDHLNDFVSYTFNLCELCLRKLFMSCKIPPKVVENFADVIGESYSFEQDQIVYEYNQWLHNGGHHEAFLNKLCNARKNCPNLAIYSEVSYDEELTEYSCCETHSIYEFGTSKGLQKTNLVKFVSQQLRAFL